MKARKPDIEIRRKLRKGGYYSYLIVYWKPLKIWLFGKNIL